jgi:hypothetical protein
VLRASQPPWLEDPNYIQWQVKCTKSPSSNIQDYAGIHLPDHPHLVVNWGLQHSRKTTNNKASYQSFFIRQLMHVCTNTLKLQRLLLYSQHKTESDDIKKHNYPLACPNCSSA